MMPDRIDGTTETEGRCANAYAAAGLEVPPFQLSEQCG
jgi:hypothetical protein